MRNTDSHRTKATPPAIFDLYTQAMDKFAPVAISPVFDSGSEGFTMVVVKKPSTKDHDLWVYHFPHREAPVAKITSNGEYLTMATYDVPGGARYHITDGHMINLLTNLVAAIEARRDQVSILEIGIPYAKRI